MKFKFIHSVLFAATICTLSGAAMSADYKQNPFTLVYEGAITENVKGKVNIHPVTYKLNGLDISANVYTPANYDVGKKYPTVVVAHPNGGVKEQVAGLYAQRLAEQGYIIGPERLPKVARTVGLLFGRAQLFGLMHRDAGGQRDPLHRAGLQLHAAAGRAVGLGEDEGDVEAGGEDGLEGGGGEFGGSGEGDFHQAVIRAFLASLPFMRVCLSWDRYSTKTLPSRWSSSC